MFSYLLCLQHSSHNSFGTKLSALRAPPWLSQNTSAAQDPWHDWGVPDCAESKSFSSLQRFPPCPGHGLSSCRQDRAAVPRRRISLDSLLLPAQLLQAQPQLLPFAPPRASSGPSLQGFNLWDKQIFTQADKSALVSAETPQLTPGPLEDMTRAGCDWREQSVLCCVWAEAHRSKTLFLEHLGLGDVCSAKMLTLDETDQAPEGWAVSLQRERPALYSTHWHFLWVIFSSWLMTSLIGISFIFFSGFPYSSSGFEKFTECSTFLLHYKPNPISFLYWLMGPVRDTSCWLRIATLCPFHDQFCSELPFLLSCTCVF